MTAPRGWGWWDAREKQFEHLKAFNERFPNGIPVPRGEDALGMLQHHLAVAGAILVYLHAVQGDTRGHIQALKESIDDGIGQAKLNVTAKTTTEAQREAWAYNDKDLGETLRIGRRQLIELRAVEATLDGLTRAAQASWDTASRMISVQLGEIQLTTGRLT